MAVTNIPNVQNWTVTPQNGQVGYFDLMNTWLGQSTLVIASLQSAITAQNLANAEINTLASQAESNAIIATGLANYQGEYSASTTYSKGQSTSVAGLYYTSKVDGNLDHAVTDTNYWLPNPINNKVDKGSIIENTAVGIGYGVGAGGSVTQLTSKSTVVALSKPCGQIITCNSAIAAGVSIGFTLFNNLVSINDNLLVAVPYPFDTNYTVRVGLTDSTPRITLTNVSGSSLSEAVPINFAVIKGVIS